MTPFRRDLLLFVAALAVRWIHLAEVRSGPLFRYLFIDSAYYDEFARRLASGAGFPEGAFFMNVLYGVFLVPAYVVFGDGEAGRLAALALQAVLGAGAVVLTYRLGLAVAGVRVAVGAAIGMLVFGPAIFYDAALLTPSLVLLLTIGTTWVAVTALARTSHRAWAFGLGLATGLLILARANHALLLLVWAAAYLVRGRRSGLVPAVLLVVGAGLVVLPVTVRNFAASGEWVPVTANGGMALWAGNHPGATGIYSQPEFLTNPVPEREAEDYRLEASRRAGEELTLAQSSSFWVRESLRRWTDAPSTMLALAARKARLYFHATESQTNLSYYFAMDHSRVLSILRLHLGWVMPFALIGMVAAGRRHWILLAPVAVSLITCVAFYVSSEYRHPVVPLLMIFAAMGVESTVAWIRAVSPRHSASLTHAASPTHSAPPTDPDSTGPSASPVRVVVAIVGVLLILVAVNYRDPFLTRLQSRRVDYLNFGTLAVNAGELGDAERFFRRSVEIDPTWPVSRGRLGDLLQRQGRVREAGELLRGGVAVGGTGPGAPTGTGTGIGTAAGTDPFAPAPAPLADAQRLFEAGRFAEAQREFLRIADQAAGTQRAPALNNAGLSAMRMGNSATADSLFQASSRANPAYASPVVHRGRLALALGDSTAARDRAREALTLAPDDGRARRLLARASGAPIPPE